MSRLAALTPLSSRTIFPSMTTPDQRGDGEAMGWQCTKCERLMAPDDVPNAITLHCENGDSASGEWCDECWPQVQARLLMLTGLVGSA